MTTTFPDLAVLKFGSSVLRDEGDLPRAVGEIYRHVRDGRRVVAVVSALAGTTDRLLDRIRRTSDDPQPAAVAGLLATGEQASAALLALHLERAGLPATLLDVRQLDLRTRGPVLDAEPVDLDTGALTAALRDAPVAVVPGFVGVGGGGRTTLLGRGGSDTTALFVALRTGAGLCRLLKDVDGLYERDPAAGGAPRRFDAITWDDALRLDPRIIQPKGVRFAREQGQSFEVGALGSTSPTRIGAGPTRFDSPPTPAAPRRPRRVVLLGLGTVGGGVARLIADDPRYEVVGAAVRDLARHTGPDLAAHLPADVRAADVLTDDVLTDGVLTDDIDDALARPHDITVELIGGREPATSAIASALAAGRDVVTANKEVIALHGPRLEALARRHGARLRYGAAVGGAMPALEVVVQAAAGERRLEALQGVLNGTTNYVLDRLAAGVALEAAVAEAQARGYAEADPTLDLDGFDAACKLVLLARAGFGVELDPCAVPREGLLGLSPETVRDAARRGRVTRLVASARRTPEGLVCRVAPMALPLDHPLARVEGAHNRLLIECDTGRRRTLTGKGAGRWPTARAVVADLDDLLRAPAGARPLPQPAAAL